MSEYDQAKQPNCYSDEKTRTVMICLMGEFRRQIADNFIQLPAGGKMETLLFYLALQAERMVAGKRLIQTLWPSSDLTRGLSSLNTLVYNLHKLLGSMLNRVPLVLHEEGYYVTLILRLNLDEKGELSKSELVDTTGSLSKHFIDRKGLHQGIDDWLNQRSQSYSKKHQPGSEDPQITNSEGSLG